MVKPATEGEGSERRWVVYISHVMCTRYIDPLTLILPIGPQSFGKLLPFNICILFLILLGWSTSLVLCGQDTLIL